MKELAQIVNESIGKMIEDGSIEKMIQTKIETTVAEIVNDSMKSYSDFGKDIKSKIEESIKLSRGWTLPSYNNFIIEQVKNRFSDVVKSAALTNIDEILKEEFPVIEGVQSADLIIDYVKRQWKEDAFKSNGEIELSAEFGDSETSMVVKLKHPEYDWYDITLTLYNHDEKGVWKIGYINENSLSGGRKTEVTQNPTAATYASNIGLFLLNLYAQKVEFKLDADDFYTLEVWDD
ncbi:hypothetical protein [uncultured Psychrosphaera sp.]|uniref:hypothetical protein n=1 Tax=uncultured Psychrosphaera sp. TaxID=1403522 RepID=UPI002601DF19|nr:hypothetical protein [uncultured Psychrosphaera sp.]